MFFFYNYDHLLNHLFVKFNWPTRHQSYFRKLQFHRKYTERHSEPSQNS